MKKFCVLLVKCKFKSKGDDLMHVQLFIIMLVSDIIGQSSDFNQVFFSTVYYLKWNDLFPKNL